MQRLTVPLGQSKTRLRNKTCFMMDASLNDIQSLLAKFEKFKEIFPVAKRAQKITLLFSPFSRSLELKDDEFEVIDDVTSALGTYVFTDGCGLMSPEFAKEIQKLYLPSITITNNLFGPFKQQDASSPPLLLPLVVMYSTTRRKQCAV